MKLKVRVDMHYHANIHRSSQRVRSKKERQIRAVLKERNLDCLTSTEHSYKDPLQAYHFLLRTTDDLPISILPGVEAVTAEGIDILFYFRDEDHLIAGIKELTAYKRSHRDVGNISRDLGAISGIPHPFYISKTSAGRVLSAINFYRLLGEVDYIEIHNSSALTVLSRLRGSRTQPYINRTMERLRHTVNLPQALRGSGLGWAIGSDAHFPEDQFVVGESTGVKPIEQHFFDFLQSRVRFSQYNFMNAPEGKRDHRNFLAKNCRSALQEGILKRYLRATGKTIALSKQLPLMSSFSNYFKDFK